MMEHFISRPAAQITARSGEHGPPGTCPLLWARSEQTGEHLNDTAPEGQRVTLDKAQDSGNSLHAQAHNHPPAEDYGNGGLPHQGSQGTALTLCRTHPWSRQEQTGQLCTETPPEQHPCGQSHESSHWAASQRAGPGRAASRRAPAVSSPWIIAVTLQKPSRDSWESGLQHCPKHWRATLPPRLGFFWTICFHIKSNQQSQGQHPKFRASCSYPYPSSSLPF